VSEVLARIVAQTRRDLDVRKGLKSLSRLEAVVSASDRSFEAALRASRTGFILECKKASPSRGLLRPNFDPAALASDYAWGADAISVLTDGPSFQGRLEYLTQVREAVSLPVLCKDFVVDPYQVYEARAHGADAILLMLSVLGDAEYRVCREAAEALGVDVLTEVHDEQELARALDLDARIVGVNNRNLKTLDVDLAVTEALAPKIPADRVRVAESGVFSHADVRRLRGVVDAFLVGTSLVIRDDVPCAVRELVAGRFKVCGLTRPVDALAAWNAGATWGGLIFAAESPRCVDMPQAKAVRGAAPLRWVGVFVNEDPDVILKAVHELDLAAVQLHGDESQAFVTDLRARIQGRCEVWRAIRVKDRIPTLEETGADRLTLDAFAAGKRGGTGERFDWGLLAGHPERERIVLGGGLGPENVAEADALDPWALDVNSGVESAPGEKSAERLALLLKALRGSRGET
jgi:indole-3-glycerol phosphate synthase / phosphoribosylanthranilate isomerase